ncbi:MAG TPA: ABC transporter substrate-binding protein, partial [Chloroflexota bacterium]
LMHREALTMWFSNNVRRAMPLCLAAILLAGCGGSPAAAPASSAAPAQGSSAAKPSGPAASAAASGQAVAIRSAYTTTSGTTIPVWVAKEGGYFAQNGLDVSLTIIAPGAPILAAIESGDVPISEAGGQEIVNAEISGSNLVMVGGFGSKPTNSIITIPSIQKPEDLKGKTIGVSGLGAVSHVAGLLAVDKLGLKGQVNFIATGGLPETLAGITSGKVDGGVLSPPQTFQAVKQGLREVVDIAKLGVFSQTSVVVTTRKYASDHPDIVERYLRAKIQGTHRAYTDQALAMQVITKYAKISDPDLASKTYDYFHDGELWGKDGLTNEAAIQTNLDVAAQTNAKAKDFKPAQMVDMSFIQKIKASGLIDQLWGKSS